MSVPIKYMELKPDRTLLNPDFDGYKLSLENYSIRMDKTNTVVDRILPDANQYSLLHAKQFALNNHLWGDTYNKRDDVYFVDQEWQLQWCCMDCNGDILGPINLWDFPEKDERGLGCYNVSFKFVSDKMAVISDGAGKLYILSTDDRDVEWDDEKCFETLDDAEPLDGKPFVISDGVVKIEGEQKELHLLLYCVENDSSFYSAIYWVTITCFGDQWGQTALRNLQCRGEVQYLHLEKSCKAIYVVSEKGCKFVLDSENPIKEEKPTKPNTKLYTWSQNLEDITIKAKIPEGTTKTEIYVKTEQTKIEIKCKDVNIIAGDLFNKVDASVTTWSLKENVLEVCLSKQEVGLMWPELVVGDKNGEYVLETCIIEETNQRLGHLCSDFVATPETGTTFNSQEVEECDFESDSCSVFERISAETHKVTHRVNLGSQRVLITCNLNIGDPPALGIRHDVDVCFWQPKMVEDDFKLVHEKTLYAFGYIQASKQQRKFSVCPPDCRFAAICETSRHLFLYQQETPITSGELKNRTTGARVKTIAKQQVINIPSDEILGIYAGFESLFLLSDKLIYYMKI